MPSFVSSGVTIHYADAGNGPPLVFVHGWSMTGRVWLFQAEEFSPAWRVICPDLRGHGRSGVPASPCTIEDFAADLEELFATLDLREAVVVGWSLGVQVVLQAFAALRERLRGVVLVSGTPRFTATDRFPHGRLPVEVQGMGVRLRRNFDRTLGEFFKGMFGPEELTHDLYQRIVKEIVIGSGYPLPEVVLQGLDVLATADLRDRLPAIDLPVLLIHGEEDAICLPGASRYMAERLPHAELRLMPGVGHAPFLSRPGEFNTMLHDYLKGIHGRD